MSLNRRIAAAVVGIFILLGEAGPAVVRRMSLQEAIGTARSQSVAALEARHAFVSTYWAYRSYQASRLPSLVLYGGLMNFDRSLTLLQSYEDGSFRYAEKLVAYLSGNRRVRDAEVWSGGWNGRPSMEFVLDYDFARMTLADVNPYAYYGALESLLYERRIGSSEYAGEPADITLRSSDLDRYDLWHVLNSPIDVSGKKMTLSSVGGIDKRRTGLVIRKSNQSYELVVCYDFIGSWELGRSLSRRAVDYMNSEVLPIGFKAEVPGWGWFDTAKKQYAWLLFLILAVMYVILAMTFESFRYPLAVIFMVPVSFIGLFLAFGLSDFSFDQGGFAAFVMLSGIVVNAGIYLVTTYQSLLKDRSQNRPLSLLPTQARRPAAESVEAPRPGSIHLYVRAFSLKIIPITLTIVSTILGLVPFLTDGPEEIFWFDFALGTISGMLFSVLALIFVLPVFCVRNR